MSEPNDQNEKTILQKWSAFWFRLVDLTDGLDREGTVFTIKNSRRMEGANAWMLMCSIMIASLGLDMNSPAVIIGAMLISPLMAPILGIGLSVATNDFDTLIASVKQFSIAIGIAVVTSTIYFWITPLGNATPEILSRTSPTLLDVLIGVFGGIAGIVSTSRKDQSSALPGVAIATALMPPLCVTGFGLATGNWNIALKSFYLFFLNTFFVALATYFIVRLLKFPNKRTMDDKFRQKKNSIMALITLIIVVPSVWIFIGVIKEARLQNRLESFVEVQFKGHERFIDSWDYIDTDSINHLIIKVYGMDAHHPVYSDYQYYLDSFRLENTVLDIIPTSEVDLAKVMQIEAQLTNFEDIADQLTITRIMRSEQDLIVDSLQNKILGILSDTIPFNQISSELKAVFPDLKSCALAKTQFTDFEKYKPGMYILWVEWAALKSKSSKKTDKDKIINFVTTRTGIADIRYVEGGG